MRYYVLATILLLAAPVAAQYHIENRESCKADDVLVFEEDGKLWCRQPIDDAVALSYDSCRVPDCREGDVNLTVDWPELEFTTRAASVAWTAEVSAPAFSEIIGPDTGFLLRLDGTWQLIVNNAPYTCTPEEERK